MGDPTRRFILRLARTMGMPASELCERMTMEELMDHWTDDRLEPWGPIRGDWQAAQICTAIVNSVQRPKRPVKMADMVLGWYDPKRRAQNNWKALQGWVARGVMRKVD